MGLYLGLLKISNLGETFTPREILSVNGKTSVLGNITVYGSDTKVSEIDQRTVSEALSAVVDNIYTKDLLSSVVLSVVFEDGSDLDFEVLIKKQ